MRNNIKRLRRAKQLSQAKMGKELGIEQTRISGWELGKSEPKEEEILKLADYFSVSPAYVRGETQDKNGQCLDQNRGTEISMLNYEEQELVEIYRYLDGYGKNHLMMTAKILYKYYNG